MHLTVLFKLYSDCEWWKEENMKTLCTTVVYCLEKLKKTTKFSVRVDGVAEFRILDLLKYETGVSTAISAII
jgi:hypothetical protein